MTFLRGAFFLPIVALLSGCGVRNTEADPPSVEQVSDEFVNVLGDKFRLPGPNDCKAVALIFVGYNCSISNSYSPEIVRLCREFMPQQVSFCVVYADADLTVDDARKHASDFGYCCPALLDPEMKLARKVGASVVPECAVLSPNGELLYRGRINDLYVDFGKKRAQPSTNDLKDTLNAVLARKPIPVSRTKAVGCYIDLPEQNN